ncbi:unnamed protein product [Prunus armeniaca]|uniref:Uncharacterized protein n=1 Tax=Prunus armeniaca TaxID=36596 RepID=A0A6J5VVD0_PRUAR|nr:unnamed protein product [Prunus armeniaca]CAB4321832.1 unnamed protein product [Prunus armeniaca]
MVQSNPVLEAFGSVKTVRITIPAALGNLSRFNLINVVEDRGQPSECCWNKYSRTGGYFQCCCCSSSSW